MAAKTLNLGDGLRLPADAVTQTFAILAKRGMGKTYTGAVIAEEMLELRQRVVVVDPVGVWWGLRSSADGKGAGYPAIIFGGDHADLPLEPGAGELVANLVVDQDVSVVLDLSLMRKGQQREFMTAFLETLYHRNRRPLHVIVDEADAYAPQRPVKGAERLLGAMEDLVRRGRARGIGVTLITQRAAVLNKDVLTQTEALVAMRVTGPQDRNALDDWIKQHGTEEERAELLGSLASLPVGTAWIWSPGWLDLFRKVKVRTRRTFDSSATPKVGERVARPKGYADVDLDQLREQMADVVQRAEAEDPKRLQKRIRELQQTINRLEAHTPEPKIERVEIPVLDEDLADQLLTTVAEASDTTKILVESLDAIRGDVLAAIERARATPVPVSRPSPRSPKPEAPHRNRASTTETVHAGDVDLPAGARRILGVLASWQGHTLTRAQVGAMAKVKHTGGTFGTYVSRLRTAGYIDGTGDQLQATAAGIDAAGVDIPPMPTTRGELAAQWADVLPAGARTMLDIILEHDPQPLTREQLGELAGIAPTGGTFGTYLSKLRTPKLIHVDRDGITLGEAFEMLP